MWYGLLNGLRNSRCAGWDGMGRAMRLRRFNQIYRFIVIGGRISKRGAEWNWVNEWPVYGVNKEREMLKILLLTPVN